MENEQTAATDIHFESRIDLSDLQQNMEAVRQELKKVIVGHDHNCHAEKPYWRHTVYARFNAGRYFGNIGF